MSASADIAGVSGAVHRALTNSRLRFTAAAILAGYLVMLLLDRPVHDWLAGHESARGVDWLEFLRVLGYLPLWVVVGVAVWLADRPSPLIPPRGSAAWRGPLIVMSAGASGLIAEVLKFVVGRERPRITGGTYGFRPLVERFDPPSLGFPSSHVAVACGGAIMLAMIWPRTWPVAAGIAVGCTWARISDGGAHFLTDAGGAAAIAYVVARFLHNTLFAPRATDAPERPETA